jgi:hypothetical protein
VSTEWKPAAYEEGWWRELSVNTSAWIYRPTEKSKRLGYFIVSVHFRDEPARICSTRLSCDDPQTFLPEATRFLQSKSFIPSDLLLGFPEATSLTQPDLL